MLIEVFKEAWTALGRNRVRSLLTMTGISWGIVAVTLLLSYGSGFRSVLLYTFEVFGKGAVICWPGTTSEQAGGERAGKAVRFEQEDADWVKAQSPLVKRVTLETVKFRGISHDERLSHLVESAGSQWHRLGDDHCHDDLRHDGRPSEMGRGR